MPPALFRAEYDALERIARSFRQQANETQKTQRKLKGGLDTLQGGDWIGAGANAFYREMESDVLPAVARLARAMESSADTTAHIAKISKTAEEEAARLFKGEGALGMLAAGAEALGEAIAGGLGAAATAISKAAQQVADTDAILTGSHSKDDAPSTINLPDTLDKGMKDAWKNSFPGGHEQEQGGILVKTKDGAYKWIPGEAGNAGSWTPNFEDIGDNEFLGPGHTHPYDSGDTDVPFSSGDIRNLFNPSEGSRRMTMVQSGDGQFVLSRTPEFDAQLKGKSDAELTQLRTEMTSTYDKAVAAGKKEGLSFAERHDAAVKAVADEYDLLYYKGKDGNLQLQ